MESRFVHQRSLPVDRVRLLTLVSDGETFRGSLEEFPREGLPYFNALSWCWPGRDETHHATSFECDGQMFPVSQQLYTLLSNLNPRDAPSSLRIWVDFISIDQHSFEEKNAHVGHMHEIYGQARNVIVWLGLPGGDSHLVLDTYKISHLNEALRRLPSSSVPQSVTPPELPPAEDPIWRAIGRLCDQDWFYRTWVIQEIALARKAELVCGSQRLGWDDFVSLVQAISRAGFTAICRGPRSTGTTRPDGFGVLMDLSWVRTMAQADDVSLSYLLHMVRLKEVTKPVDKVYGLLGILGGPVRKAIKVNYEANDEQYWNAYSELARHIITTDSHAFWLLCMASSRERPEELPTWCPNFHSLTANYLDFAHQRWRAGIREKSAHGGMRLSKDPSAIQISGFQIDVVGDVVYIGGPYATAVGHSDSTGKGSTAAFMEKDSRCLDLTLRCFDDASSAKDAYARTLIVNSWINGSAIQLSQSERVCRAYEDSREYLESSFGAPATSGAQDERQQLAQQFITQLGWWQERPFYTTKNGRIGRGACNMQAGDAVCVFYEAGPVFILRHDEQGDEWKLVGDAYLHGCMDLDRMPDTGRGPDTVFTIS
jgi:hypothetical protein